MATLASLLQMPENDLRHEFLVDTLHYPAYDTPETQMICSIVGHDSSRYHHIYSYLHDQIIPDGLTRNEKRHLIRNASRYVIIADDLFRRSLDGTLLRCLESNKSKHALVDVHKGICGSHSNGLTLARKLIRAGYYWPNLEQDAIKYARSCKQCQLHGNRIHAPARELIPFVALWPFQQWAFDLVGQIHPSSSNGHKFIITATDYFTKWVEAVPLSVANGKIVALFITN